MSKIEDGFDSRTEIHNLKDNFKPHNLSKKFCEAITSQKDIDIAIKGILKEALANDVTTQNLIKNLIKDSVKEEEWKWWQKALASCGALTLAFISGGYLNRFPV